MSHQHKQFEFDDRAFKRKAGFLIGLLLALLLAMMLASLYFFNKRLATIEAEVAQNNTVTTLLEITQLNAELRGIGARILSGDPEHESLVKEAEALQRNIRLLLNGIQMEGSTPATQTLFSRINASFSQPNNLLDFSRYPTPAEWLEQHNRLINSEIDLVDYLTFEHDQNAKARAILGVRKSLAEFIHFAGLERARVSLLILNNTRDASAVADLEAEYASLFKQLSNLKKHTELYSTIKTEIDQFEAHHYNLYTPQKQQLLGNPLPTLTTEQWWELATQNINRAKAIADAANTTLTEGLLNEAKNKATASLYIDLIQFLLIVVIFCTLVYWLTRTLFTVVEEMKEKGKESFKYAYAIESSPINILITDQQGGVEFSNSSSDQTFATAGVAIKNISDLPLSNDLINLLLASFKENRILKQEVETLRGDIEVSFKLISSPIQGNGNKEPIGYLIALEDITEQKNLEKALLRSQASLEKQVEQRTSELQTSEARMRSIVDMAASAIITIDTRGQITSLNPAAQSMFGYSEETLLGENISMLMPQPHRDSHDGYLGNYLATGKREVIGSVREVEAMRSNGEAFPISLSVSEVKSGKERFYVGMINDMTERKAFEESLRIAKETAERVSQIKSSFLANMSHELRTPMNGVIGMTELVLESDLSDEQRKYLRMVLNSAKALLNILNEVLDLAKLEDGRMTLSEVDFSLNDFLEECLQPLKFAAEAKGLTFTIDRSELLHSHYKGDSLRIRQVLINLIGNAIKFTEQGWIKITIHPDSKNKVRFEVSDSGIGIPADRIDSIFESFTQADDRICRRFGGTGLGTTISKQLVELMGGKISVESIHGQGSTFGFSLPLKPVAAHNDLAAMPELTADAISDANLSILVAEDQSINQQLIKIRLESRGHTVTIVEDGEKAVEAVKQHRYDLVLMDGHMPILDGYEATKVIRNYEKQQQKAAVPIIALTASVMLQDRRRCIESGMNGFVGKPIDFDELFTVIHNTLAGASPALVGSDSAGEKAIINYEAGLQLWQGAKDVYQRSLLTFSNTLEQELHKLKRAIENNDLETARGILHSLSGAAGNLHLDKFADLAKQFELQVMDSSLSTEQRAVKLEALTAASHNIIQTLAEEFKGWTEEPDAKVNLTDPQAILIVLREIEFEIQNGQSRTETLLTLNQQLNHSRIKPLITALDAFDFDTAAAAVSDLIHEIEAEIG